jgi:alkylhydroperoxidase family enzyme
MSRLVTVEPTTASGKSKELFDAVKGKLGIVPNMTRVMVNSPAVLEAYLGFSGSLASGVLDAKLREQLALVTAQQNHCDYCLSPILQSAKWSASTRNRSLQAARVEQPLKKSPLP